MVLFCSKSFFLLCSNLCTKNLPEIKLQLQGKLTGLGVCLLLKKHVEDQHYT